MSKKTLNFVTALQKKKNPFERCWIASQSSLIGATTTKQRKHQLTPKCVTKILKNPYFCSAKMVPEEVVLFLTLEVVLKLTLESQKSGTKTNSPAYIYIYIYRILSAAIRPPCPTYQVWPFSPAKENHPKMPIRDPQNEFPGVLWIGLFSALLYSLTGNPEFPGICRHFPEEGFGGPQIAFLGEDEVDMLDNRELSGSDRGEV